MTFSRAASTNQRRRRCRRRSRLARAITVMTRQPPSAVRHAVDARWQLMPLFVVVGDAGCNGAVPVALYQGIPLYFWIPPLTFDGSQLCVRKTAQSTETSRSQRRQTHFLRKTQKAGARKCNIFKTEIDTHIEVLKSFQYGIVSIWYLPYLFCGLGIIMLVFVKPF